MSFKHFPQFVEIHRVKGFSVVKEAEIDVFLEFPYLILLAVALLAI